MKHKVFSTIRIPILRRFMGGVQNLQFLGFPHGSAWFNWNTGAKIKKHGGARSGRTTKHRSKIKEPWEGQSFCSRAEPCEPSKANRRLQTNRIAARNDETGDLKKNFFWGFFCPGQIPRHRGIRHVKHVKFPNVGESNMKKTRKKKIKTFTKTNFESQEINFFFK